jgi:transposase-like protein
MSLSSDKDCLALLEAIRWSGKPVCPYCGSDRTTTMPKERRHRCNNCNTAFSVTVGTVFHRTHLSLRTWFAAVSLILDAREPISARRLAQHLNINKNTAWYLDARICRAMLEPSQRDLLLEIADVNETHADSRTTNPRTLGVTP